MRRIITMTVFLVTAGLLLAGCGSPPPLKSDKYLSDMSLVSQDPCGPPCFRGIEIGKTTYTDATAKVKADSLYSNVQVKDTDKPPSILWSTAGGETCCVLSADQNTGLVNALLIHLAPNITAKQVIDKYGPPKYVFTTDYSDDEVAVAFIYPDLHMVLWIVPGNADSTLKETDPVVMALYENATDFQNIMLQTSLQGWNGYLPYQTYKAATPVITAVATTTPQ